MHIAWVVTSQGLPFYYFFTTSPKNRRRVRSRLDIFLRSVLQLAQFFFSSLWVKPGKEWNVKSFETCADIYLKKTILSMKCITLFNLCQKRHFNERLECCFYFVKSQCHYVSVVIKTRIACCFVGKIFK